MPKQMHPEFKECYKDALFWWSELSITEKIGVCKIMREIKAKKYIIVENESWSG